MNKFKARLLRMFGLDAQTKECKEYMARMRVLAARYEGDVDTPYDPADDVYDVAYEEAMELKKVLP